MSWDVREFEVSAEVIEMKLVHLSGEDKETDAVKMSGDVEVVRGADNSLK